MQLYKDFAPTAFDAHGLALDDRQDWIVAPVGRNRDSGPLDESNFAAALEILGGESETCEVHRFGHWACGWLEIVIVSPDRAAEVEAIEDRLANYPVLDESDLSNREYEDYLQSWSSYGATDFKHALKNEFNLGSAAAWAMDELSGDRLREIYASLLESSYGEYESSDSGAVLFCDRAADECSRDRMAEILREARAMMRGGK